MATAWARDHTWASFSSSWRLIMTHCCPGPIHHIYSFISLWLQIRLQDVRSRLLKWRRHGQGITHEPLFHHHEGRLWRPAALAFPPKGVADALRCRRRSEIADWHIQTGSDLHQLQVCFPWRLRPNVVVTKKVYMLPSICVNSECQNCLNFTVDVNIRWLTQWMSNMSENDQTHRRNNYPRHLCFSCKFTLWKNVQRVISIDYKCCDY